MASYLPGQEISTPIPANVLEGVEVAGYSWDGLISR
jgi:hypothetical protein